MARQGRVERAVGPGRAVSPRLAATGVGSGRVRGRRGERAEAGRCLVRPRPSCVALRPFLFHCLPPACLSRGPRLRADSGRRSRLLPAVGSASPRSLATGRVRRLSATAVARLCDAESPAGFDAFDRVVVDAAQDLTLLETARSVFPTRLGGRRASVIRHRRFVLDSRGRLLRDHQAEPSSADVIAARERAGGFAARHSVTAVTSVEDHARRFCCCPLLPAA